MKKKQSYQNGSIRKRGNKYYYRFRMEEPDGTMKLHEYPGTESKRETHWRNTMKTGSCLIRERSQYLN